MEEEEAALNIGGDSEERQWVISRTLSFANKKKYGKAIMCIDVIWNLAFALVSAVVLVLARKERPSAPLRIWVSGYALQCLLHVGFLYLQRRRKDTFSAKNITHYRILKRLESIDTMISFVWWITGFYWIVAGGQALLQDSPQLYWLTVVFLAFDVSFAFFCITMAFIFIFAVFCCIPLVAIAYAVATRQGASEDEILSLPKYTYRLASPLGTSENAEKQDIIDARVGSSNSSNELALYQEDSECCICLSQYADGVELNRLPCNHHFHRRCISKWLHINATCPVCKFNIRSSGDTLV
ncbi:E3 ubiquitin-protein ligase At1g12760-like [Pistacia vera]|uniref:E3 ubiquitin-protein ligase At1g12760-like n=1 Tax=Pistacia vera TaxID=55513 RepID=UPI0012639776|nr:E3 ubiquitin-protein ligase At1g12760-like [Pistacia vera]